jgi:hypothetical protein
MYTVAYSHCSVSNNACNRVSTKRFGEYILKDTFAHQVVSREAENGS